MKTQVQQIRNYIQGLNPKVSTVSSIGSFVSKMSQQVSDSLLKEVIESLPEGSLAHKIVVDNNSQFSEKQLWVISFELEKNADFCKMVSDFYTEIEARKEFKHIKNSVKKSEKAVRNTAIATNVAVSSEFEIGQTVNHKVWGSVLVSDMDNDTITVIFNGESKKLLKKYAPLTK